MWVWPLLHRLQQYPAAEQVYRPFSPTGPDAHDPLTSADGLPVWTSLSISYAVDPEAMASADEVPANLERDLIEPLVKTRLREVFAQFSMADMLSDKRQALLQNARESLQPAFREAGLEFMRAF